jgi:squalene-associated FAD-dependent desaturase
MGAEAITVVGGGLAGISAALALADLGSQVTLFESRAHLGGRVASVRHPRMGVEIDNCQHAAFRVYDCFFQLLGRASAQDIVRIQSRTDLPFVSPEKKVFASLRTGRLSPPNHMMTSMMRFPYLSIRDKLAMRKAIKAFAAEDDESQWRLDDITFEKWLESKGQTPRAIERFFGFFTLAALNLKISEASAAQGVMLFRSGLFGAKDAFDVVAFTQDLGKAMNGSLLVALKESGVEVRTSATVKSVARDHVIVNDERIAHDHVVIATPPHLAARLLKPIDKALSEKISALEYRALIGIHAFYRGNRVPDDFHFAAMIDEPLIQMIFNRNYELDEPIQEGIQWVSVPVSGADDYLHLSDEEIMTELTRVLECLWPENSAVELVDHLIVKVPKATFAPTPGSCKNRPHVDSAGPNISLAGSYTMTGWPSTMESATRSGLAAAARIHNRDWNLDDEWPDWPSRPQRNSPGWKVI